LDLVLFCESHGFQCGNSLVNSWLANFADWHSLQGLTRQTLVDSWSCPRLKNHRKCTWATWQEPEFFSVSEKLFVTWHAEMRWSVWLKVPCWRIWKAATTMDHLPWYWCNDFDVGNKKIVKKLRMVIMSSISSISSIASIASIASISSTSTMILDPSSHCVILLIIAMWWTQGSDLHGWTAAANLWVRSGWPNGRQHRSAAWRVMIM